MRLGTAFVAVLLILTSCARGSSPGSSASPVATVEVTMRDDNTYEPREIEVERGRAVRFVVVNAGKLRHEFLIGNVAQHQEHETQMAEGEKHGGQHGEEELPGLGVAPGDKQDFTYTFPAGRELIFACHEPGHFEAGMRGEFRYRDSRKKA